MLIEVILSELHNVEEKSEGTVIAGIKDSYSHFLVVNHYVILYANNLNQQRNESLNLL